MHLVSCATAGYRRVSQPASFTPTTRVATWEPFRVGGQGRVCGPQDVHLLKVSWLGPDGEGELGSGVGVVSDVVDVERDLKKEGKVR